MGGRDGGAAAICASGGDALNVALLMPEGERANREGPSQGISNYCYSPGRLAEFRRKFESVTRRAGVDPATFATEFEILAVRGFGDMGTRARKLDGPGQVYCGPTELWTVGPPRQCSSDPGDS